MLADFPIDATQSGRLSQELHRSAAFVHALLDFIADELPRWRDDSNRSPATSETALTEHLCDYLTSAARLSPGWDVLQFRTEVMDEQRQARKIDLAPKPCGATIWIDGRRHTQYDSLMPVECKRLPTPKDKDRDEREYVFSRHGSTGGIQRFKDGVHGASHSLGAMVGYVQTETTAFWQQSVTRWINELAQSHQPGWTEADLLEIVRSDETLRSAVLTSKHDRGLGRSKIELWHLWLEMN